MGWKELESCDLVAIYPEVVREGVLELDMPPRWCRGIKRKLGERIDACFSGTTASADRVRHASTRGMSQSRRFFDTATHSSTSSQSNQCLSKGSGRGKGVGIHGRRRLCSQRGQKNVKTDFRELALHVFILGAQQRALLWERGKELNRLRLERPACEISENRLDGFEVDEMGISNHIGGIRIEVLL